MAQTPAGPLPDLAFLLPSWEVSLRTERKSAQTREGVGDGVSRLRPGEEWNGEPPCMKSVPAQPGSLCWSAAEKGTRPNA